MCNVMTHQKSRKTWGPQLLVVVYIDLCRRGTYVANDTAKNNTQTKLLTWKCHNDDVADGMWNVTKNLPLECW